MAAAATSRLVTAARQVFFDLHAVPGLSLATTFFHNYPRIFPVHGDPSRKVFSLDPSYRASIVGLTLPFLLTGFLLVVGSVSYNLYKYFKHGISPGADDTNETNPTQRNATAKAYLLFSAFLHICILLLIGVSFGANVTMRGAIRNSHHAIDNLRDDVEQLLVAPATFLVRWADFARNNKRNPALLNNANSNVRKAVDTLLSFNKSFHKAKHDSIDLRDNLILIDNYLQSLSFSIYFGITATLTIFILGNFLVYICDVAPPRAHRTRIATIALFALPLGATWAFAAFSTSLGAAAGDFCVALNQYHTIVVQKAYPLLRPKNAPVMRAPKNNIFINYNLLCPSSTRGEKEFSDMLSFFDTSLKNGAAFSHGMGSLDKQHSFTQWSKAMQWMEESLKRYRLCKEHVTFAAHISYHMCGDHNSSSVSSIAIMWLAAFALCLLFAVVVFLSSSGVPTAEFATAHEMLRMYGAPKLISAFGDIESVLTRQATFKKIASKNLSRNATAKSSLVAQALPSKSFKGLEDDDVFDEDAVEVEDFPNLSPQSSKDDQDSYDYEPSVTDPSTESNTSRSSQCERQDSSFGNPPRD